MAACKFPFFTLMVCTWSDALAFLGDHLFAKCPGQPASFVGMKYVFDGASFEDRLSESLTAAGIGYKDAALLSMQN
uniref:Putative secreted protein n=1 Tax=Ixodes scapularis TaxID=6945 RepID=A0A4D5RAS7_IXOSC